MQFQQLFLWRAFGRPPRVTSRLNTDTSRFSSRGGHTRLQGDWSSDVCSSDLQHTAHDEADDDEHDRKFDKRKAARLHVRSPKYITGVRSVLASLRTFSSELIKKGLIPESIATLGV